MRILKSAVELKNYIEELKDDSLSIGFVPTMGALHDGHLSLYKKAKKENDIVISSIFVNPTQFNNPEDLQKYPRNVEKDIEILDKSDMVDAVYIPEVDDLYPQGLVAKKYDFEGLDKEMEGKFRPGHFDGVGTVVEELLKQVQPDRAYFGEKDFQQLAIIKKLVEKNKIKTEITGVPILREANGLAMSSRNMRLSEEDREEAKIIHETLLQVNEWFRVVTIPEIKKRVEEIFAKTKYQLEYFIIADEDTLKETDFFYFEKKYRAFIVVNVDGVRLIDNMKLD